MGLSNAALLSKHNSVIVADISAERVDLVKRGLSPIRDADLEAFLKRNDHGLSATTDTVIALSDADFIVIATPTNYDPISNSFDTTSVVEVARLAVKTNPRATLIYPRSPNFAAIEHDPWNGLYC